MACYRDSFTFTFTLSTLDEEYTSKLIVTQLLHPPSLIFLRTNCLDFLIAIGFSQSFLATFTVCMQNYMTAHTDSWPVSSTKFLERDAMRKIAIMYPVMDFGYVCQNKNRYYNIAAGAARLNSRNYCELHAFTLFQQLQNWEGSSRPWEHSRSFIDAEAPPALKV
jgi:hypothetical protein